MEGMEMDGEFAAVAVEIVAQGVIGNRVDEMESGFLMALDYMIQLAQKDGDDEVAWYFSCPIQESTSLACIYLLRMNIPSEIS
jgi:hypothetical protein